MRLEIIIFKLRWHLFPRYHKGYWALGGFSWFQLRWGPIWLEIRKYTTKRLKTKARCSNCVFLKLTTPYATCSKVQLPKAGTDDRAHTCMARNPNDECKDFEHVNSFPVEVE